MYKFKSNINFRIQQAYDHGLLYNNAAVIHAFSGRKKKKKKKKSIYISSICVPDLRTKI